MSEQKQMIYIPIGLPGCGKSTYYAKHLENKGVKRVSADDLRFSMLQSAKTGIYFEPSIEPTVWHTFYAHLGQLVREKADIYIDATNLTCERRNALHNTIFTNCGDVRELKIKYLLFTATPAQCWANQANRERKVDLKILEEMYKTARMPQNIPYLERIGKLQIITQENDFDV